MELKHLTIAVATALGLSTAAMAQTGDMGKQRGTTSEPSASATQGMASSDDVRQVQQELQNRGFNVGTVDGVMGPQTKGALKEFQQAEGLPATGELNEKTKSQLKTSSAGSRASGTTGSTGASGSSGTTGSRSSGPMTGSSSNPNAPSTNSSDSQGASSPATPGSAPRGGSAGSGVKGSPSPNSGTTGSTTTSPNTGAGSMTNPGGSPPKPSTDKPKTGDSSK